MTLDQHVEALRPFGYSKSEARFVALSALHSGYFLARQYRDRRGSAVQRLCEKVLAFEHATTSVYSNRTTLYHLNAKPLYRALGQEDNRHRREHDAARRRIKVMGLDYILLNPGHYLPTEEEKVEYFAVARVLPVAILPQHIYTSEGGNTTRYFVEKYPVRVDLETGHIAFAYIDAGVYSDLGFASWINKYLPLIRSLESAEVVYVATSEDAFPPARRIFTKFFLTPNVGVEAGLLSYFELRRDFEERGFTGRTQEQLNRFRSLKSVYSDAGFDERYEAWKAGAPAPAEASQVVFTTYVVPYSYGFLGTATKDK